MFSIQRFDASEKESGVARTEAQRKQKLLEQLKARAQASKTSTPAKRKAESDAGDELPRKRPKTESAREEGTVEPTGDLETRIATKKKKRTPDHIEAETVPLDATAVEDKVSRSHTRKAKNSREGLPKEQAREKPPRKSLSKKKGKGEEASDGEVDLTPAVVTGEGVEDAESFIVGGLGKDVEAKPKREEFLPAWLREATVFENSTTGVLECDNLPLSAPVLQALRESNVTKFFPVQAAVIPPILAGRDAVTARAVCDVLVCAPTGSGKTLAYAVPIVEALRTRVVVRLRALIIVPTRDLVLQVHKVVRQVAAHTDLRVGTVVGQTSFHEERAALVHEGTGESKVDILVATPGRLIDHISTDVDPGGGAPLSLQHVRYLVVDEMDRLLAQEYQEWLPRVVAATRPADAIDGSEGTGSSLLQYVTDTSLPLQKLLFSATLARDAEKMAALRLHRPRHFSASTTGKYTLPETLKAFMVVCAASFKPVVLLRLAKLAEGKPALCFTASVEAAHRLARLLELVGGVSVAEYTRKMPQKMKQGVLERFRRGKIGLLICSDVMARGIDILDVETVINYDVPVYLKTYIHRVGRTARAGALGTTYTLCQRQEVRHFKQMLAEAERGKAFPFKVTPKDTAEFLPRYQAALPKLKQVLDLEQKSALELTASLVKAGIALDDAAVAAAAAEIAAAAAARDAARAARKTPKKAAAPASEAGAEESEASDADDMPDPIVAADEAVAASKAQGNKGKGSKSQPDKRKVASASEANGASTGAKRTAAAVVESSDASEDSEPSAVVKDKVTPAKAKVAKQAEPEESSES